MNAMVTDQISRALMHFVWQGIIVAGIVAILLRWMREQPESLDRSPNPAQSNSKAGGRYVVSCIGLLVMAVLPMINYVVLDSAVGGEPQLNHENSHLDDGIVVVASHARSPSSHESIQKESGGLSAPSVPLVQPDSPEVQSGPTRAPWAPAEELVTELVGGETRQTPGWMFQLWLLGIALMSIWHLAGWWISQRRTRASVPVPDEIAQCFERLRKQLRVSCRVSLRKTFDRAAPVVIGCFRPAVLVPGSILTALPRDELEAILAHELAHIRRHDYLVNLLQSVVETFLFYHPAVWWISRRIRIEREYCADDLAVRMCDRRETYARSLMAVAELTYGAGPRAVAATGWQLLPRVARVLQVGSAPKIRADRRVGSTLLGVASMVFLIAIMVSFLTHPSIEASIPNLAVDIPRASTLETGAGLGTPAQKPDPRTRIVIGRITDSAGKPIANALVEWGDFRAKAGDRQKARSDSNGQYKMTVKVPGPDYRLGVSHPGYAPVWFDGVIPGTIAAPKDFDFTLAAGRFVSGVVVDTKDQPVAGLSISAIRPSSGFMSSFSSMIPATPLPGDSHSSISDSEGVFKIEDLPDIEVGIRVISDTYRAQNIKTKVDRKGLRIVVRRTSPPAESNREIRGRVIDSVSGEAVKQFSIVRRHSAKSHPFETGSGQFKIGGFAGGRSYETYVYSVHHKPLRIRLESHAPQEAGRKTIRLESGRTVRGRLLGHDGNPLANETIICFALSRMRYIDWGDMESARDGHHQMEFVRRVSTARDGTFEFGEDPKRPTRLVILKPGFERVIFEPSQRERPDDTGHIPFRLRAEASLTGRALDEGKPVVDAQIGLWRLNPIDVLEHNYETAKTDAQGRYELHSLQPGTYLLRQGFTLGSLSRRFTIRSGEKKTLNVGDDLGEFSLEGQVGSWCQIGLKPEFDWEYQSIGAVADPDGHYRVEGLRPGKYTVRVSTYSATRGTHFDASYEVTIDGDTVKDFAVFGARNSPPRPKRPETKAPVAVEPRLSTEMVTKLSNIGLTQEQHERQQEIIKAIKPLKGRILFASQLGSDGNILHRQVNASLLEPLGPGYREPVLSVNFDRTKVKDADLAMLRDLPFLESVSLWSTGVTAQGLKHIVQIKTLRRVGLTFTKTTDEGLELLSSLPNLESLILQRTEVTDDGIAHLRKLTKLQYIRLYDTNVTDEALRFLAEIPSLTRIDVRQTMISTSGLRGFMEKLPDTLVQPQISRGPENSSPMP